MSNDLLTWNANQPFYEFMRVNIWDKISEYRRRMYVAEESFQKLNAMEVWLDVLIQWHQMMQYYLDDEENEKITKCFDEIDTMTNSVEFSNADLNPNQNTKIRNIMRQVNGDLWKLSAKYGMLPAKKSNEYDLPAAARK